MSPIVPLVALAGLLLVNRVVMPRVAHRAVPFWSLFGVNLAVLAAVAVRGMPGTGGHGPARWVIAALLVYHLVLYVQTRARLREDAQNLAQERALLRQLREARAAGIAAPPVPDAETSAPSDDTSEKSDES